VLCRFVFLVLKEIAGSYFGLRKNLFPHKNQPTTYLYEESKKFNIFFNIKKDKTISLWVRFYKKFTTSKINLEAPLKILLLK